MSRSVGFDEIIAPRAVHDVFSERRPSVASVLPSRTRTVVAVVIGCSPSPALKWPLWMMDWV